MGQCEPASRRGGQDRRSASPPGDHSETAGRRRHACGAAGQGRPSLSPVASGQADRDVPPRGGGHAPKRAAPGGPRAAGARQGGCAV